jgi:hypothetical protein
MNLLEKREIKQGRVGLSVGSFAPAYYSNFSFSAMSNPPLKRKAKEPEPTPAGRLGLQRYLFLSSL